ncbi:MAG: glcD: glycolate oxidase, subunit GlcD [Firmicutes bacterium]|nr:glcD: glycolate oxidase, subunit GlcD [Bacillota bacterium]
MANSIQIRKVTDAIELQEVFRQAQEKKTPVSLYRKAQPGGIALDFSEWKEIEVFDIDNLMVIVPPGTLLKELNAVAAAKGLRFIPADTPAYESLTVGEWAYRGCPNPSVWKYGAGKHFLLGGNYVLPNGDITPVGGKCIKNVTGYDFTRFLTGAYADLAVGVRYIIKLMPQPAYRKRYDVIVPSLTKAIELIHYLQSRPVPPAWLFWADEAAGSKLFGQVQTGQRILFELDGNEAEVLDYAKEVDAYLAVSKNQLAAEPATIPALSGLEENTDGFWLLDELKSPYTTMETFAAKVAKLLGEKGVKGGLFGQLADGKINLYLSQKAEISKDMITALQAEAYALGGAASGKYDRLYERKTNSPLAALEIAFKQRIDPQQIFNQGVAAQ